MAAQTPETNANLGVLPERSRGSSSQISSRSSAENEKARLATEEPTVARTTLTLVVPGLCLAIFAIALDRTIVATAVPVLSNQFKAFDNFSWYGSSYLLTSSVLGPTWGRLMAFFHNKILYLTALTIFFVGSVICATANDQAVFIGGRAMTGVGGAGLFTGAFMIMNDLLPDAKRPLFLAVIGMFFNLGSVVAPIIGGAFTSLVSWRWCFYISLPLSGLAFIALVFYSPKRNPSYACLPLKTKILALDLPGSLLLISSIFEFFYAFSEVDQGVAWNSSTVIGLLTGSAVTIVLFIAWSIKLGENSLMPWTAFKIRTVWASFFNGFFLYSTTLLHVYFLSIFFQAVNGYDALHAGIALLPYIASMGVAMIIGGAFTTKTGLFAPPAWIGSAIYVIGSGLLTTMHREISTGKWVGYQILAAFGAGLAIQQSFTGAQTATPKKLSGLASAMVAFAQTFGAALFMVAGNTLLIEQLKTKSVPGVDIVATVAVGATAFESFLTPDQVDDLKNAYSESIRTVMIMAAVTAALAFLFSLCMEMLNVKTAGNQPQKKAESASEA